MKIVLNVAEKPSIAKKIQYILNSNNPAKKIHNISKYNPVYELNRNFLGEPSQ